MKANEIRRSLQKFKNVLNFNYPAMGWYYSDEKVENAFEFKHKRWVCMFMYINVVLKKNRPMEFSGDYNQACCGPAEYFGFIGLTGEDGVFIAEEEKFKKSIPLAKDYYKESLAQINKPKSRYLYMEKLGNIEDSRDIEVINLFPDFKSLSLLSDLSSYDRRTNCDNVMAPFASGCQSMFTIPMNEGLKDSPASVIGLLDALVRNHIPEDMIAFCVSAVRFVEMAENIEGSWLGMDNQ